MTVEVANSFDKQVKKFKKAETWLKGIGLVNIALTTYLLYGGAVNFNFAHPETLLPGVVDAGFSLLLFALSKRVKQGRLEMEGISAQIKENDADLKHQLSEYELEKAIQKKYGKSTQPIWKAKRKKN